MQILALKRRTVAFAALLSLLAFHGTGIAKADTGLPKYDRVRVFESPRIISDAELIDQEGRTFQLSQLQGRVALVFFGFTHCTDTCPLTMTKFSQLEESGAVDPEKVAYVLISVDAERDRPAVLKAYLARFSPRFIGLTGDPNKINAVASNFSASFFPDNPSGPDSDYTVAHSRQAFVLDPAGKLRAEFYGPSIEAMAGIVRALLAEVPGAMTDKAN